MASTYPLRIVSQESCVFEGDVESLVAPGALGYLGVLAHHAPLLTSLTKGDVTIRDAKGEKYVYQLQGGILEVSNKEAIVLADRIVQSS